MMKQKSIHLLTSFCLIALTGCDIMSDKLDEVGRVPPLSKVNIYEEPFYPVHEQVELRSKLSDLGYENGDKYDGGSAHRLQHNASASSNSLSATFSLPRASTT